MKSIKKIKTLDEIVPIISEYRKVNGGKIVQCHGVFDLLHPGHYIYFEEARQYGSMVLAVVTSDRYVDRGADRPVFNQQLRMETLAKNEDIDYVVLSDFPTAVDTLLIIKPDVYVKGSEYENLEDDKTISILEEKNAVESVGGELKFTYGETFSSSGILNKYFGMYPKETQEFLEKIKSKYSMDDVTKALDAIKELKVAVIGDIIIDEYCYCIPWASATKRKVLSNRYVRDEVYAGGVLATANHLASFCDNVALISACGEDRKEFALSKIKGNIDARIFNVSAPTVVKRRYIDELSGSTVFYVSKIDESKMDCHIALCDYLNKTLGNYDIVIVNDFGHGLLSGGVISILRTIPALLCVNAQTNSLNMSFTSLDKYGVVSYLCQSEFEIRLAVHNNESDIEEIMKEVFHKRLGKALAVTLGSRGSVIYDGEFHYIPALAKKVVDTTGAGDAFLAITSPLVACNVPMNLIGLIGNAVGALQVQIVGNKESVNYASLIKFVSRLLK